MTKGLRESLDGLMRTLPGWENLTSEEIEKKTHDGIMNLKLIEPLHHSSGWRKDCQHMREHILEDEDNTFRFL